MEKLLGITEVAEYLGVKESTIYGYTHERRMPFLKVGSLLRFKESDLKAWIDDRTVHAKAFKMSAPQKRPHSRLKKSGSSLTDKIVRNVITKTLQM